METKEFDNFCMSAHFVNFQSQGSSTMRSIVICSLLFLTACQTNANNRSNVNSQANIKVLEDKLMSAVIELIDDIAKEKMTLNEGGIKLGDSPLCSYRAPDAVRTVCRIGAIAAFDAAKSGYNGRAYRTLVNIRLDNEVRGLEASVAAQREAVA